MLTIKHCTTHAEALYQGDEVVYHNGDTAAALQVMYRNGKEWHSLLDGVVYVMNDAGSTVAKYEMYPETNISGAVGIIQSGRVNLAA